MMILWSHQFKALADLQDSIDRGHRRICLTSPTGGGKTRMAVERMKASRKKTVFYTHRRMLLDQTSDRFMAQNIGHGFRASGHRPALLEDIQLAMIRSEYLAALEYGSRDLHPAEEIIIDEAHSNKAENARALIDAHDCVTIGLTATPLGIGDIYDDLIVAGTNKQLRECGSHVVARTYAPSEPDKKIIGSVEIGKGTCGIRKPSRAVYAQKIFGNVLEHWKRLNPDRLPTLLFAPGVAESIWFAEVLTQMGIRAAHIDGESCWLDGQMMDSTTETRAMIEEESKSGRLPIVCNRFVLREGVDWPHIYHGILATVFGSLTAFLQAGGRIIRACPGMDHVIIQDHGGNWWRHGSLNADREWTLDQTDAIAHGVRMKKIQDRRELEPIHCPKCSKIRLGGSRCPHCGYQGQKRTRPVLQSDGSLKEMRCVQFIPKRRLAHSESLEKEWAGLIHGMRKSRKPSVIKMTFNQVLANFARNHSWEYPPESLPMMPTNDLDWFRPVQEVPLERLSR